MDWVSRRELKIFLTVFLLLGLFAQWYGVNANSRIDLTRSIVERGALDINPYRNNTADRSYYQGDYYSDKAPGLSLLATPIYAGWKMVYNIWGDTTVSETPRKTLMSLNKVHITSPAQPGAFYLSALILLIWLTATLPVAILTVLIYRVSGDIVDTEWKRLATAFGFAFGTLITHYGTGFLPAAAASLFGFGSFYLLYQSDNHSPRLMAVAGVLGGVAVTVKATAAVILIATFIYAWRQERLPVYYVIGGFLGGMPYMLYNTIVFGAPWRLPRSFVDPVIWKHLHAGTGLRLDPVHNLFVAVRLLVSPYRGLFYWFPFLLFGVIGFRRFLHEKRDAAITTGIVFLGTVGLASMWWAWWHGGAFGPRLLVTAVPFLMLAVAYGLRSIRNETIMLFLVLSITVNLAGLHGYYEDMLKDRDAGSQMVAPEQEHVDTVAVLANPIRTYYLPGLMQHGPQSRIMNGLYNGDIPPDIRAYSSYEQRVPVLLLVWILVLIPVLIWQREIKAHMQAHRERILSQIEEETC